MAFTIKDWEDYLTGGTPLDAAALEDLEERVTDYTDSTAAGGIELGYADITTSATRNSTSYADVSGLSTTVTVGSRPIVVRFDCGAASNNAGTTGGVSIVICEDGGTIGGANLYDIDASTGVTMVRELRRNPSAGSHTYKVRLKTVFGGTATLSADSGSPYGPCSISVREI